MQSIQIVMRSGQLAYTSQQKRLHQQASNCPILKCALCEFGKAKRKTLPGKSQQMDTCSDGALTKDKLIPRQAIFIDHFICSTKGRLQNSFGKSPSDHMHSGGALFIDDASKAVFV